MPWSNVTGRRVTDIGEWYQDVLTQDEIQKIQAAAEGQVRVATEQGKTAQAVAKTQAAAQTDIAATQATTQRGATAAQERTSMAATEAQERVATEATEAQAATQKAIEESQAATAKLLADIGATTQRGATATQAKTYRLATEAQERVAAANTRSVAATQKLITETQATTQKLIAESQATTQRGATASQERTAMADVQAQLEISRENLRVVERRAEAAIDLNRDIFNLTESLYGQMSQPTPISPVQVGGGAGAGGGAGGGQGITAVAMPPELQQMMDLFSVGGEYGAGAKAEIERGAQQSLAAGQIGLSQTGMGSGTTSAGLSARVTADAALARAGVEDKRIQGYAGALGTAAGMKTAAGMQAQSLTSAEKTTFMQEQNRANIEAQRITAASQSDYLRTLAALKPSFVAA